MTHTPNTPMSPFGDSYTGTKYIFDGVFGETGVIVKLH
jgi:hypothetical protein